MATFPAPARARNLGLASIVFGFLGLVFWFWRPLGIILSLAGLMLGFIGWLNASRRATNLGLPITGTLLSVAALILDLVIALRGLQIIDLLPYR